MKALLTACTAIACAATQVTWLEGVPSGRASVRGAATARPDVPGAPRAGARPASAHGASALVAPALPVGHSS
jgi:hypothetical protein